MEKEFKVYEVKDDSGESSWVYARNENEALLVLVEYCVIEKEDIDKCTLSIVPKERWPELNIISNEPDEMPDMTVEEWMKNANGIYPDVIASAHFLD